MPFMYGKKMNGRDVAKMSRETGIRQSLILACHLEDRNRRTRSAMVDYLVKS